MTMLPALMIEPRLPVLPAADLEAAAAFARQEKAPATRAAYRSEAPEIGSVRPPLSGRFPRTSAPGPSRRFHNLAYVRCWSNGT
jgi:hypothetical protein